jgi:hypothetical protein
LHYARGCDEAAKGEIALNQFNRLIALGTVMLLLAACDKAVTMHKSVSYLIKGGQTGALYPLDVKEGNEDVRVTLKDSAPVPEIVSIDASGNEVAFNFTIEDHALIMPGKFEHLRLRHEGNESIDIFRKEAVK